MIYFVVPITLILFSMGFYCDLTEHEGKFKIKDIVLNIIIIAPVGFLLGMLVYFFVEATSVSFANTEYQTYINATILEENNITISTIWKDRETSNSAKKYYSFLNKTSNEGIKRYYVPVEDATIFYIDEGTPPHIEYKRPFFTNKILQKIYRNEESIDCRRQYEIYVPKGTIK